MTKNSRNGIISDMAKYLAIVIISAIASVAVTAAIVRWVVLLIMRQIKLYRSINLVELKTNKIVYWIFAGVVGFMIFYLIMQMSDAQAPSVVAFREMFGVSRLQVNIAFMFALIVMIAAETFIITLASAATRWSTRVYIRASACSIGTRSEIT